MKNKLEKNVGEEKPLEKTPEAMSVHAEREKINEVFFQQYIETEMEAELFNEIKKAGFTDGEVIELRKRFSELGEQDKEYGYAMPYELRKRNFAFQARSVHSGKKSLEDFWGTVSKVGIHSGRRLGYHISKYDTRPKIEKGKTEETWFIEGTESDHRNNDQPMAYYSENYKNLYRDNGGNFLYVISSLRGSNTGHYVDGSNHWGRALNLEVVQKFDLRKVDDFVNQQTKEYLDKKKTPEK